MDFDDLTQSLLDHAVAQFHATEQYRLLQEKRRQMHNDCACMLMQQEQDFAEDCFDLLDHIWSQQAQFVYRKGLCDGVRLLKNLGVLA